MTTMTRYSTIHKDLEMDNNIIRCECGNKVVAFNEEIATEEVLNNFNGVYVFEDKGSVICNECGSTLSYKVNFDVNVTISEASANVDMTRIVYVPINEYGDCVNIKDFYEGDHVNLEDGHHFSEGMNYEVRNCTLVSIYNAGIDSKQLELQLN